MKRITNEWSIDRDRKNRRIKKKDETGNEKGRKG